MVPPQVGDAPYKDVDFFEGVNFRGGQVERLEWFGEDMLEVFYPNHYMVDVGYIDDLESFVITIIKDNDWVNVHKEIRAKSEAEMRMALQSAIDDISCLAE